LLQINILLWVYELDDHKNHIGITFAKMSFMKLFIYTLIILCGSIISCAQPNKPLSSTVDNFEAGLLDSTIQLLDVRTLAEYNRGHIKNALQANWNNQTEFATRTAHLQKEKPLYVYCQAGSRSAAAAVWLQQQGFSKVVDLSGGLLAWQKANKSVQVIHTSTQYTAANFNTLIGGKDVLYLVDIGAAWCAPCIKMKPVIDSLQKEYSGKFTLINIDAGIHIDLQTALKVEKLPTFIVFKNGVELNRITELTTKGALVAALFK
jgi:rhodanese-related sulfurtransferase